MLTYLFFITYVLGGILFSFMVYGTNLQNYNPIEKFIALAISFVLWPLIFLLMLIALVYDFVKRRWL